MVTLVNNKQGFKVISMDDMDEILRVGCGFGNICDFCGEVMSKKYYYVAMLNRMMCEKCYKRWIAHAKRHKEDILYEMKNFYYYAGILGLDDEEDV